ADVAVDEPGRHLAGADTCFDRSRPWPYVLVGHERHWRNRSWTMTLLAGALENGRQVFRKRRRGLSGGLRQGERGTSHEATERECQTADPPSMLSRHANLQEQCSRNLHAKITLHVAQNRNFTPNCICRAGCALKMRPKFG